MSVRQVILNCHWCQLFKGNVDNGVVSNQSELIALLILSIISRFDILLCFCDYQYINVEKARKGVGFTGICRNFQKAHFITPKLLHELSFN